MERRHSNSTDVVTDLYRQIDDLRLMVTRLQNKFVATLATYETEALPADVLDGEIFLGDDAKLYFKQNGIIYGSTIAWQEAGEEFSFTQVTSDVLVSTGATVSAISATVTFGNQSFADIVVRFPSFEFTGASGGEAQVLYAITPGGESGSFASTKADRAIAWPLLTNRRAPIPGPGTYTIEVSVKSITGAITLHADTGGSYGPITLRITPS